MKKVLLTISCLLAFSSYSQEHFSGINISKRVGLLNATLNPAELNNLSNKYEIGVFNVSANISNNKISIGDILNDDNVEDKIFVGSDPVNMRVDALIQGPGFAFKHNKWAFAITSAANIKANAVDVDVNFGNAVTNSIISSSLINSNYNQRLNAMTWGEIGLATSRTIFETTTHKFNAGATFKLLFPGSYMNFGVDQLSGTVTNVAGDVELSNAIANVNISYSGNLANNYNDASNYNELFAGGLNGFGVDFGFNYQWKEPSTTDEEGNVTNQGYKLNAGLSVRNIGSMKFKEDNNVSNNYKLEIEGFESLNLNQFDGSESVTDIEQVLLDSGYLTKTSSNKDFKVNLPAVLNLYVDYHVYNKWYISGYTQQKISDDTQNDFSTIQNIITLTPRFAGKHYEIYVPFSQNEISKFTTGFGFRLGGFFMGSGSAITALLNDSKQADFYMGFRIGF